MVYRVYRVYGYFQKSSYGIFFTVPTTTSGGWESDLLYRVLETRKNRIQPPTAPHTPVWGVSPVWGAPHSHTVHLGMVVE